MNPVLWCHENPEFLELTKLELFFLSEYEFTF